jgi:hypothetical protein
MDSIVRYFVVEKDTGKKYGDSFAAQAPATSYAKQLSKSRVRWKRPDPVLLVEERVYTIESITQKRVVMNGEIFDAPPD